MMAGWLATAWQVSVAMVGLRDDDDAIRRGCRRHVGHHGRGCTAAKAMTGSVVVGAVPAEMGRRASRATMMVTVETGGTDTVHGPDCCPQPDVDGGRLPMGVDADVPWAVGCAYKAELTPTLTAAVVVALVLDAIGSQLRPGTLASLGN